MKRILSLRGGGIRGYATAILLAELEKRTGLKCYEMFDLIAGTSVGAILAVGLAIGIPAEDLITFFRVEGHRIFAPRRPHWWHFRIGSPRFYIENLIAALQRHFVIETVMSDARTNLMTTCTRYQGMSAKVWKSWKHKDMSVVTVAAMSAAAPTYFNPVWHEGQAYCDGGMWANNPAPFAAIEATKLFRYYSLGLVDISCPCRNDLFAPRSAGLWQIVPHLTELFMEAGADGMNYLAQGIIQPPGLMCSIEPDLLEASHDIGDASDSNMERLYGAARYDIDLKVDKIVSVIGPKPARLVR